MDATRSLDRRAALKGVGVSLALPWLESVSVAAAGITDSHAAPIRLVATMFPLGVNTEQWWAKGGGDSFELSPTLQPLMPIRHQVLAVEGMVHPHLKKLGSHAGKVAAILTGEPGGRDHNRSGRSFDQLLAERIGSETELPSLALGISPARTGRGFYDSHISWRGPDRPVAKEIEPQTTFDMLFGDKSWLREERSVLDFVLGQAQQLNQRISLRDQQTMAEYFDCIRELELRIQRLNARSRQWQHDMGCDPSSNPVRFHPEDPLEPTAAGVRHPPEDFREHTRLMLDLLVLALQMDKTRIVSFMFDSYGPQYSDFSFIPGVKGQWHAVSHHKKDEDLLHQYHLINRWHITQYAYLLQKMDAVQEGERTLLDNSLVMITSDMWCGNVHNCIQYPLLLSGSAGGQIRTGRHLAFEDGSMSRLFLSIAELMGAPQQELREATQSYGTSLTG